MGLGPLCVTRSACPRRRSAGQFLTQDRPIVAIPLRAVRAYHYGMSTVPERSRRDAGDILTASFGVTIAMWAAGYLSRIAGLPNWALFFVLLAVMLVGGFLTGRSVRRSLGGFLVVGLLIGFLNLLILGSALPHEESRSLVVTAAWAVPAWLALCSLFIVGTALVGSALRPAARIDFAASVTTIEATPSSVQSATVVAYARRELDDQPSAWPARFALVALAATALLLVAGGVVTGFEAGMAVPDWPSTFGYNMFLYPLARMTGGVYFEHSHRLLGSLVGLTTLVLAVYVQFAERRWSVRIYALALLAAVIFQGVMGGLRVIENDAAKAAFHGVFAQVFFAGLAALVVLLSPTWRNVHAGGPAADAAVAGGGDRNLSAFTCALVLIQIIVGARLRHFFTDFHIHVALGVLVAILAAVAGLRAWIYCERTPIVAKLGGWLMLVVGLQLLLGFGAFLMVGDNSQPQSPGPWDVGITTAHQTTGAIVLAMTVALTLWRYGLAAAGERAGDAGSPLVSANEPRVGLSGS